MTVISMPRSLLRNLARRPLSCSVLALLAGVSLFSLNASAQQYPNAGPQPGLQQRVPETPDDVVRPATPGPAQPNQPPSATTPVPIDGAKAAQTLLTEINKYRSLKGVPQIRVNPVLQLAAQEYATYLAANRLSGDFADGKSPKQRVQEKGYTCAVSEASSVYPKAAQENEDTAGQMVLGAWKAMSSEEANMTSPRNTEAGGGAAAWSEGDQVYYVFVQMYGEACGKQEQAATTPPAPAPGSGSPQEESTPSPGTGQTYSGGNDGDNPSGGDGSGYRGGDGGMAGRERRAMGGWLGVQIKTVDEQTAERFELPAATGAVVLSISPEGPAAQTGLRFRDVIQRVNERPVMTARDLAREVAALAPGQNVQLHILRGRWERDITVKLGTFPRY